MESAVLAQSPITPLAAAKAVPPTQQRELMASWLKEQHTASTRKAYAKDLRDLFRFIASVPQPTPELVSEFLALDQFQALILNLLSSSTPRNVSPLMSKSGSYPSLTVHLSSHYSRCPFFMC